MAWLERLAIASEIRPASGGAAGGAGRREAREDTMFAVIRTGGKQYRVAERDVIAVDKILGAPGDIVELGEVLILGGEDVVVGTPTISGASVAAEVLEQGRGEKII